MIEQQYKRLKGPPIPRKPKPKRRQLPCPQRLSGRGKHTGQLIEITGRNKTFVRECLPGTRLKP